MKGRVIGVNSSSVSHGETGIHQQSFFDERRKKPIPPTSLTLEFPSYPICSISPQRNAILLATASQLFSQGESCVNTTNDSTRKNCTMINLSELRMKEKVEYCLLCRKHISLHSFSSSLVHDVKGFAFSTHKFKFKCTEMMLCA